MSNSLERRTGASYTVNNFTPSGATGSPRSRSISETVRDSMVAPTQARAVGNVSQIEQEEAVKQFDYLVRVMAEREGQPGLDLLIDRLRNKQMVYDMAMIEVYRRLVNDYKTDKAR